MEYDSMERLMVCRNFLQMPLVQAVNRYMQTNEEKEVPYIVSQLVQYAEMHGVCGNIWQQFLLRTLCDGENTAAVTIEQVGTYGTGLRNALAMDMKVLWPYLHSTANDLFGCAFLDAYMPSQPKEDACLQALVRTMEACQTPDEGTDALLTHYKTYGRGKLAWYMAFRINSQNRLVGIEEFPHLAWDDLISYQAQKEKLLQNTVNFIKNRGANNVLLTGARGTGKSTAVKSLVWQYHEAGLRLLQIERGQLAALPGIMEKLSLIKSKKFILFLDDLSFDEDEKEYKYLKSAIDGGVTPQPDNVLIYATSNRRHLLKETWKDRNDEMDEVYRDDSTNESISLSDRFGLIIHYAAPTQDEYLAIIDHELRKAGVVLDKKDLRVLGVRWEMEHSGRNGRIAQQFVKWYLGNKQ